MHDTFARQMRRQRTARRFFRGGRSGRWRGRCVGLRRFDLSSGLRLRCLLNQFAKLQFELIKFSAALG
jgi:hypothetical protein